MLGVGVVTVIWEFDCSVPAACVGAHSLHGRHYIGLLVGERLPETRCPREVMRQVVEHRRKLCERL